MQNKRRRSIRNSLKIRSNEHTNIHSIQKWRARKNNSGNATRRKFERNVENVVDKASFVDLNKTGFHIVRRACRLINR